MLSCLPKALIARPELVRWAEAKAGQEVRIYQAQTSTVEAVSIDQVHHLLVRCRRHRFESSQQGKRSGPVPDRAQCQFAHDHGMHADERRTEQELQRLLGPMEVVNPDRRVDEDQAL